MELGTGTYRTCVDSATELLELLFESYNSFDDIFIGTVRLDFRFFKMLFWSLDYWDLSEYDQHLHSAVCTMMHTFRQMVKKLKMPPDYELWKTIIQLKDQARRICLLLLGGEYKCKPCQQGEELFLEYAEETTALIQFVQETLEHPYLKIYLTTPVKPQIGFILGKLKVFSKFGDPIIHGITRVKKLGELMSQTRTWANHISCISCLYWIHCAMKEKLASSQATMPLDLMHKIMHYTPGVVASHLQGRLIPQLLGSYVDFLLEGLVTLMKDEVEILREGLILLLSFLMDPPEHDSEERELILGQIYAIVNDLPSLISSIHCDGMRECISKTELFEFLPRIDGIKDEVREHYAMTPHSTKFHTPTTNAIGFLDSLLRNLKQMLEGKVNFIPRVKQGIQLVCKKLASLRPFLQDITELQNEVGELKDIWTRIVNVLYYAAYVTKLSSLKSSFTWYGVICLPNILEEIKLIETNHLYKTKMHNSKMQFSDGLLPQATTSKLEGVFIGFEEDERFRIDPQMYINKSLSVKIKSGNTLLPQPRTLKVERTFVGFREDAREIIDHLIGGRKDLTFISISGMPGQRKTTLAKRIFDDPKIQYHFNKTVWCYVSKECKIRDLMIEIVYDVDVSKVDVEGISKLEFHDLVEMLRRSLKRTRYLIVMDDIWDIEVWRQVQGSFPDDKEGSRILVTSRNKDLVSQTGLNFISYPLRSFSEEESWELMKEKLLDCNGLGPEYLEIGKQIAICCKGLPLAVALVSALLGKIEQKLDSWNQVAENLKSYLANEGCMQVIELSYKYLPDHLKSCFLYFGAFPRGDNVRVKRLKLLWIAEGFIKENEMRYSEDLAEELLEYLISQSLVVVTKISPLGRIKRCNVHDLVYDLCLEKIVEDNFLHFVDKDAVLENASRFKPQKYCHHRVCCGERDPFIRAMPLCTTKGIPTSQVHSLLCRKGFFSINGPDDGYFCFLKSFKVLTVLDLETICSGCDVLPEVILCNIHLKYLALFVPKIDCIPPSITDLWNLETFILRGDWRYRSTMSIPDTMWRMKSLRHVNIYGRFLILEDFEGNESYVAAQNIETLCGVILEKDPHTVEFLRKLVRLRKLNCHCEGEVNPSWFPMFGYLKTLEELKITRNVSSSSNQLETCNFPHMINLKKLSLKGLRISWTALSTIRQQFPNLEVLELWEGACVGSCWDLEDGKEFSKLRYLTLWGLDLERINVSDYCDTPFPCLEQLLVDDFPNLKEIPSEFGDICTLNIIKLGIMSYGLSKSAMQVLQQQRDKGNDDLRVIVTDLPDRIRPFRGTPFLNEVIRAVRQMGPKLLKFPSSSI